MNIAAYAKYESYRDSGIHWVPKLPSHWVERRSKFLFRKSKELARKDDVQLSATQSHGVIPQADYEAMIGRKVTQIQTNLEKRKHVEINDFVISMRSFQGGLERAKAVGCIRSSYVILKPGPLVCPDFYAYLLKMPQYIQALQLTGNFIRDGQDLNFENFSDVDLFVPPLPEQRAIAAFLDGKCVKIDEAVRIKEEQIKLLRERRQILIQQAVTRGLNPDAPMKDSGIDWIGQIPAHWDVFKLRYIGRFQNGISEGADYFGSGHPFVTYGDVFNNEILPEALSGLAASNKRDQDLYSVKRGDIFFTRTSEVASEIGIACACNTDIPKATFSGFLIRFRPTQGAIDPGYARFLFRSNYVRIFFAHEVNTVTRASLGQDLLKNLPVFVPPIDEQIAIARDLCALTSRLDEAISIKDDQMAALKEYKTSLINAAVTGKIKVI